MSTHRAGTVLAQTCGLRRQAAGAALLLGVAALVLPLVAGAAGPDLGAGSQDAFRSAGPQAAHIQDLWRLTLLVCSIVFAAVLVAFLYAIWHGPRSGRAAPAPVTLLPPDEPVARRSVLAAVAVSTILLFVLIVASVLTDRALAALSLRDALHIEVTAHQWWWEARYDDPETSRTFSTANELHIPVGRPVILTLSSDDVIHSFWVPNLAGKKDLIPGRRTTLQLRADQPGVYRGQCAEFCGLQHTWMAMLMVAQPSPEYEDWAERQRSPAAQPVDSAQSRGREIFMSSTCVMCHAIAGTSATARKAPDLSHVGSRKTLAAGALENTPEQLASWIANPQQHKPGTNMPSLQLPPQDLRDLSTYLGSLK
jgi:cytochrome c oxidase subunit 2